VEGEGEEVITDSLATEIAFLRENPDVLAQQIAELERVKAERDGYRDGVARRNDELIIALAALREITQTDWDSREKITPFQFEQRLHKIAATAIAEIEGKT
jgi:hypothetical protein